MKTITVQAADSSGRLVFDRTVSGKKHKRALLLEAIQAVSAFGGFIRYQTHGAKSWARYRCEKGAAVAVLDPSIQWEG